MRVLFFLLLWPLAAGAHEVHHAISAAGAVAISLSYADGRPFAYEKYELTPEGQQVPVQVGNTDAAGRVVFLPGGTRNWRLKAYSADGHGVDLRFESPTVTGTVAATAAAKPDRVGQMVLGLAVLFGLFGLVQLFQRRRRP
jgi:nickel transport protein